MYDLRASIDGAKFPGELAPINQFQSLPTLMPVLGSGTSAQPFATTADYERWLGRMRDYIVWSDQAITNMRKGLTEHVTYPRVLMEKVLPQLKDLIVADPRGEPVLRAAEEISRMPSPRPTARDCRLRIATRSRRRSIPPISGCTISFATSTSRARARRSACRACRTAASGMRIWRKQSTTTDLAPDAIHELGLKEVARIRGEMEQVKQQVGFKGDLAAFFKFLQDDPQFYYDNGDALIQGFRDLQQNIDAKLPKLFEDFPKADYEVRAVEPFRAQSSAGGFYQPPSADGSRPGIFYVNTFNLKAQPKFGMETLSLHEASPGHHFQVSIQQELTELPRFRRFGNGYVAYQEGWALYAESIGKELGMFTDPYQYYGRLSDEMLRAMRLVVDTGPAHAQLDARAVDQVHARQLVDGAERRRVGSRALHRDPGPGARLQDRPAAHPRAAQQGAGGARLTLRRARVPQRRAARRLAAAERARGEDRPVDREQEVKSELKPDLQTSRRSDFSPTLLPHLAALLRLAHHR